MESENRKLIKFSNYSLCVTLPKSVTRKLKWDKGDVVQMVVDEKKGEILIKKAHVAKTENKLAKKPFKTPTIKKSRW